MARSDTPAAPWGVSGCASKRSPAAPSSGHLARIPLFPTTFYRCSTAWEALPWRAPARMPLRQAAASPLRSRLLRLHWTSHLPPLLRCPSTLFCGHTEYSSPAHGTLSGAEYALGVYTWLTPLLHSSSKGSLPPAPPLLPALPLLIGLSGGASAARPTVVGFAGAQKRRLGKKALPGATVAWSK